MAHEGVGDGKAGRSGFDDGDRPKHDISSIAAASMTRIE
jgi:hypothetical protein